MSKKEIKNEWQNSKKQLRQIYIENKQMHVQIKSKNSVQSEQQLHSHHSNNDHNRQQHSEHNDDLFGSLDKYLIKYCWSVKLNNRFKKRPKPFTRPRFKQSINLLGTGLRYLNFFYTRK